MGAKYLFCLPLRLGVSLISITQFLTTGALSGVLTFLLIRDAQGRPIFFKDDEHDRKFVFHFSSKTRTVGIVLAVVWGLTAIISFLGFLGAILKKASYVLMYSALLRLSLALQVAVSTAYLVFFFTDKKDFKKLCAAGSSSSNAVDDCDNLANNVDKNAWKVVVSAVVPIVIQSYGVYIVLSYARKLRDQEHLKESFGFRGRGYAPIAEESLPLTNHTSHPYADNSSSIGQK
ncbi:hypothetical protein R3P38DRAFT_2841320 [Favolaschia claudopus]|uniref:Uncharacterized protein n=1 Tax=Favolaschia claudopus TaxID=2862362 RepID=A0AAW0DZY3_9AGAR